MHKERSREEEGLIVQNERNIKVQLLHEKHLILCLCYELSLGSISPFPAHQAVSPGVTVGALLLQEVVNSG